MNDDKDSPYSKQDLTIADRWPTAGNVGNPIPSRVVATILALTTAQKERDEFELLLSSEHKLFIDSMRSLNDWKALHKAAEQERDEARDYGLRMDALAEERLSLLEDLRERCAEEARAHARHDLGLEVLKANAIGLAVRKVSLK